MDDLFALMHATPSVPPVPLDYRRASSDALVETALVRGSSVALATHFHDEDQITFVVAGRRRFRLPGGLLEVRAGHGVLIEAGTPHGSCDEPEGVACFNAYVRTSEIDGADLIDRLARRWTHGGDLSARDLTGLVAACRRPRQAGSAPTGPSVPRPALHGLDPRDTLDGIARAAVMSREAYSRAFRRTYAMPPSVFRSVTMLNHARQLLRADVAPAAVAADVGFVDQSHLGRCFRRVFGITPGRYRSAWRGSHPYQTVHSAAG